MERGQNNQTDASGNQPAEILSRERMEAVCRACIQYLETSKRYRVPDYCLWQLAHETGISQKIVSASINRYMGRNFFEFINRIRLEDVKRLLRKAAKNNQKINVDEIGAQSGFSSRSNFFMRFARYEGMTPKKYMSLYNSESDSDCKQNNL